MPSIQAELLSPYHFRPRPWLHAGILQHLHSRFNQRDRRHPQQNTTPILAGLNNSLRWKRDALGKETCTSINNCRCCASDTNLIYVPGQLRSKRSKRAQNIWRGWAMELRTTSPCHSMLETIRDETARSRRKSNTGGCPVCSGNSIQCRSFTDCELFGQRLLRFAEMDATTHGRALTQTSTSPPLGNCPSVIVPTRISWKM